MTMLIPVFLPILGAIALWRVPQDRRGLLNGGMLACLLASAAFALATLLGPDRALTAWRLTDRISIALKNDGVARFYMAFISVVWPAVGFYATGYNAHDPHLRRFNCFYLATYGVLMGLSMSANAVTLYMFYEMMTLITLPLVMHTMEKEAVAAGIKYLVYSVFGASAALLDSVWHVNVRAPMLITREFARLRAEDAKGTDLGEPGRVVNLLDARIASVRADQTPYWLSKRTLADATRAAALEFAPGLLVNGVAPGSALRPDAVDGTRPDPAGTVPLGVHPGPEAIAEAVAWLAGARDVTGQILYVDGGMHLRGAHS